MCPFFNNLGARTKPGGAHPRSQAEIRVKLILVSVHQKQLQGKLDRRYAQPPLPRSRDLH